MHGQLSVLRYLWRALPLPDQTPTIFLCQATPLFTLFSVTRTKLAVDMWKKSTMGNNRFKHMLVVVYRSLVPMQPLPPHVQLKERLGTWLKRLGTRLRYTTIY